eukprot:15336589-Ditylum_brightwellii.AAC.1
MQCNTWLMTKYNTNFYCVGGSKRSGGMSSVGSRTIDEVGSVSIYNPNTCYGGGWGGGIDLAKLDCTDGKDLQDFQMMMQLQHTGNSKYAGFGLDNAPGG